MKITIDHDGQYQGTFTIAETRQANADAPEVLAALARLEVGECVVRFDGGAGGVHTFTRARELEPPRRRGLASYRGTMREILAAAARDVAELELVDAVEGRR